MKASQILEDYQSGEKHFVGLDIVGTLAGQNLEGVTFEHCSLLVDFTGANLKGAKFIKGNIKRGDFTNADLSAAKFELVNIDFAEFKGAKTDGLTFRDNTYAGNPVTQEYFEFRLKTA